MEEADEEELWVDSLLDDARKHSSPRKRRPKKRRGGTAAGEADASAASSDAPGPPPPAASAQAAGKVLGTFLTSRPTAEELRAAGILRPGRVDPGVAAAAEAIRKLLQRNSLARHLRNRLSAMDLRQRGILRDPEGKDRSSAVASLTRALENRPPRRELARYTREIMVWTGLEVASVVPVGTRTCHAAVLHGRRLYVLGGHSVGEVEHPLSPGMLDADKGSGWSRPPTCSAAGFEPVARYAHSVVDNNGVLVIFGGYSASSGWTNDVWLLDVRSGQERARVAEKSAGGGAAGSSSSSNSGRKSALAVSMPPDWGEAAIRPPPDSLRPPSPALPDGTADGAGTGGPPAAQAVADLLTWHLPPIAGTPPCARAAHTSTLVAGVMLVVGGNDGGRLFNDAHMLLLQPPGGSGMQWRSISPAGAAPSPRAGHTAVAHGDSSVVVFGGGEGWGGAAFNDLFVLQAEGASSSSKAVPDFVWLRPSHTGTPPTPRTGHTACVQDDSMLVFGGFDGRRALNDVHILNLRSMAWSRPADTGAVPSPRAGHTATSIGNYCVVFGGSKSDGEGSVYGDVHVLDTTFNRAYGGRAGTEESTSGGEEGGDGASTTSSSTMLRAAAEPSKMGEGVGSPSAGPSAIGALTAVLSERRVAAAARSAMAEGGSSGGGPLPFVGPPSTVLKVSSAVLAAALEGDHKGKPLAVAPRSPAPPPPAALEHLRAEILRAAAADEARHEAMAAELAAWRRERRETSAKLLAALVSNKL